MKFMRLPRQALSPGMMSFRTGAKRGGCASSHQRGAVTGQKPEEKMQMASESRGPSPATLSEKLLEQKNAGLKAVTLIATLNPVSQVLW